MKIKIDIEVFKQSAGGMRNKFTRSNPTVKNL